MLWCTEEYIYLFKLVGFFLSGQIHRNGIAGHKAVLFLTFCVSSILFHTVASPICVSTNKPWGLSLHPRWHCYSLCFHVLLAWLWPWVISSDLDCLPLILSPSAQWSAWPQWACPHSMVHGLGSLDLKPKFLPAFPGRWSPQVLSPPLEYKLFETRNPILFSSVFQHLMQVPRM